MTVWESDGMKLYLGDCLEVMKTLADSSVDLIVTDPPYNIGKDYGPSTDDAMPAADFLAWYQERAAEIFRIHAGGYLYVSCSVSQLWTLRPIWEAIGYSFQMLLFWHGPNRARRGSDVIRQWSILYEPILLFLKGKRLPMLNEVAGPKTDAIIRATRPQRNFTGDLKREHPTQKPANLYWTIIARTPGQVVFDPFIGSGTTGMACVQTGRKFIGIEIHEPYFEIAKHRIQEAQLQMRLPI